MRSKDKLLVLTSIARCEGPAYLYRFTHGARHHYGRKLLTTNSHVEIEARHRALKTAAVLRQRLYAEEIILRILPPILSRTLEGDRPHHLRHDPLKPLR